MRRLEQKKLLTIITSQAYQKIIIEALLLRGIDGYTVVKASGAGVTGIQSSMLDGESSILIYVILSEARLITVLDDFEGMINRGYRIKAIMTDISILPDKIAPDAFTN